MFKKITYPIFILLLFTLQQCKKTDINETQNDYCALNNHNLYQTNPKSQQLQEIIEKYTKKGLPGISLLVKDNQGIYIGSAGMADIKENIAMQPCHITKICSITKLFLGVAIMRLQEKGILSINDPINKYLPNELLSKISNGQEPLKIIHLMNHTSGIYDVILDQGFYLQILNNPSKKWTSEELLKFVYHKKALFTFNPQDTAGYSNTNYILLAMIIEKATGKNHNQILHEEILNPLGLSDTYYYWHDALPEGKIAQGYYDLYNNGTIMNLTNWNTGSGNGYGGIYSTVWDMYQFADALFVKKILINSNSLDQMLNFHNTIESRKQLGVACFKDFIDIGNPQKDYAWGHRGRDLNYSADLFYFPYHNAILSLTVNYGTDGNSNLLPIFKEMRDEIARLITSE